MTNKRECCETMALQLNQRCEQHSDPFDCADSLIHYSEQNDEYGIVIHDGGRSYSVINYCPWCGAELSNTA